MGLPQMYVPCTIDSYGAVLCAAYDTHRGVREQSVAIPTEDGLASRARAYIWIPLRVLAAMIFEGRQLSYVEAGEVTELSQALGVPEEWYP